jgi:hypothetical protein
MEKGPYRVERINVKTLLVLSVFTFLRFCVNTQSRAAVGLTVKWVARRTARGIEERTAKNHSNTRESRGVSPREGEGARGGPKTGWRTKTVHQADRGTSPGLPEDQPVGRLLEDLARERLEDAVTLLGL